MSEICPVCEKEVHPSYRDEIDGVVLHAGKCFTKYHENFLSPSGQKIKNIKLTTNFSFANYEIEDEIGIVTAECVYGMNIFRDMFAGVRDFFGGRSKASQKVLRDARNNCLAELKLEAYELGADGVTGMDLDYSEISGGGKSGMLLLVVSGTAVKLKKRRQ
ncbi:MAG: YbjQ family protein [Gammaproteobacteria bacterium]|jgi:uncharacterized protein YbjQ (UPF0145 family)|nr:YbjQ family protein [Gammaproteobacteria bacterium]